MRSVSRIILIICCALGCSAQLSANVFVPEDLPTLEALIYLHKSMKKDEKAALENLTVATGTQMTVKSNAEKFNQARTTLNSKINDGMAWLTLASAVTNTIVELKDFIKEYYDFSKNTYESIDDNAFVLAYYTECCNNLSEQVKDAVRIYKKFAASGLNLIKATMKERMAYIYSLQAIISRCRSVIHQADYKCRVLLNPSIKVHYIWEILNSKVLDKAAKTVIAKWG